jgi:hypothetical protein
MHNNSYNQGAMDRVFAVVVLAILVVVFIAM